MSGTERCIHQRSPSRFGCTSGGPREPWRAGERFERCGKARYCSCQSVIGSEGSTRFVCSRLEILWDFEGHGRFGGDGGDGLVWECEDVR